MVGAGCVGLEVVGGQRDRSPGRVAEVDELVPTAGGLRHQALDLQRLRRRRVRADMQVGHAYGTRRPRHRLAENLRRRGEISGRVDHGISKVRAFLDRLRVGDVRVVLRITRGEDRVVPHAALDLRIVRVVDSVDEGADRRRDRKGRAGAVKRLALDAHRNRRRRGDGNRREERCGDHGDDNEGREHPNAARHSHTTAGRPVRATRFSLLNVSAVESYKGVGPGKSLMNPDVRRPAGLAMPEIVECVPNFSEGRRKEVVDAIAQAIASVHGVRVLDQEMDADHNRSVITFVGDRTSVAEAAFRGAKKAVELIDMNRHRGEHPRVGALDVLPFVPIAGVTMDDCVDLARAVGRRIADQLQVPVYLYEAAATRPDRRALPDVRRGEYEGLKTEIETNPDRKPDFGPLRLHPTAGACVVGARPVLIAWNVNLRTTDVGVAKRIAKAIRESDGGLPAVRAKGFDLADRGLVQVSMNMVDYRKTSLVQAFEAIRVLAAKEGVEIAESEIIGLVPLDALVEAATQYLKLARFHREQILETRLWE